MEAGLNPSLKTTALVRVTRRIHQQSRRGVREALSTGPPIKPFSSIHRLHCKELVSFIKIPQLNVSRPFLSRKPSAPIRTERKRMGKMVQTEGIISAAPFSFPNLSETLQTNSTKLISAPKRSKISISSYILQLQWFQHSFSSAQVVGITNSPSARDAHPGKEKHLSWI